MRRSFEPPDTFHGVEYKSLDSSRFLAATDGSRKFHLQSAYAVFWQQILRVWYHDHRLADPAQG